MNGYHQTLFLRLFTPNGIQWILYHGLSLGTQDRDGKWFKLRYRGMIEVGGEDVFGDWMIIVKGSGLESICQHITRGFRTQLKVGKSANSTQPNAIESISIEPNVVKVRADTPEL